MFYAQIFSVVVVSTVARPEIPSDKYGPPGPPIQQQYGPPPALSKPPKQQLPPFPPDNAYGPPAQKYGPPAPSSQTYGPPPQVYGPPPSQKLITKNVYVHVPHDEPAEPIRSQIIEAPIPKKHYKIIFIKAPTPPPPSVPVIPEQPQDEHKTLVYVLVKKPEPQPLVELPVQQTTEPSKPEVYFIKYKDSEKLQNKYGPPAGPY